MIKSGARRRPAAVLVLLVGFFAALMSVIAPQSASAATVCGLNVLTPGGSYPPGGPSIKLSGTTFNQGDTVTVTGDGYGGISDTQTVSEPVRLCIHSTEVNLGTVQADANGHFVKNVVLPADFIGDHTITGTGETTHFNASAALTILASDTNIPTTSPNKPGNNNGGGLPVTGTTIAWLLILAIIALIVGYALTREARRRHTHA